MWWTLIIAALLLLLKPVREACFRNVPFAIGALLGWIAGIAIAQFMTHSMGFPALVAVLNIPAGILVFGEAFSDRFNKPGPKP